MLFMTSRLWITLGVAPDARKTQHMHWKDLPGDWARVDAAAVSARLISGLDTVRSEHLTESDHFTYCRLRVRRSGNWKAFGRLEGLGDAGNVAIGVELMSAAIHASQDDTVGRGFEVQIGLSCSRSEKSVTFGLDDALVIDASGEGEGEGEDASVLGELGDILKHADRPEHMALLLAFRVMGVLEQARAKESERVDRLFDRALRDPIGPLVEAAGHSTALAMDLVRMSLGSQDSKVQAEKEIEVQRERTQMMRDAGGAAKNLFQMFFARFLMDRGVIHGPPPGMFGDTPGASAPGAAPGSPGPGPGPGGAAELQLERLTLGELGDVLRGEASDDTIEALAAIEATLGSSFADLTPPCSDDDVTAWCMRLGPVIMNPAHQQAFAALVDGLSARGQGALTMILQRL